MRRRSQLLALVVVVFSLLFVQPVSAAYIDPNTGGMLFQIIAAIFGVLSGIILIFSSRIKMLYFRVRRRLAGTKEYEAPVEDESKP